MLKRKFASKSKPNCSFFILFLQATSSGRFNSNSENVPPSFDGCQKSNGFVFPGSSTDLGFTIHVDPIESRLGHSTNVNSQTENETSLLNPAVTALPRPPLTCLENVDIDLGRYCKSIMRPHCTAKSIIFTVRK